MNKLSSLHHYQLQESLGTGSQGRTYRAIDTRTGQIVALKSFQLRQAEGWKSFELFERECNILQALHHPGIPQYLESFAEEDQGEFYLVMELIEGTSLQQMLNKGQPFSEAQLWNFFYQALDILDYLHQLKPPVIHRDIKPANLILRPDGRLALVDFGGVKQCLRPEIGATVVGTFGYMAPEQLHGESSPLSDIYSLGATLATLATGIAADKLPHKGLAIDLNQLLASSSLKEILEQMLQPDPNHRISSITDIRSALQSINRIDRSSTQATIEHPGSDSDDGLPSPLHGLEPPLSSLIRVLSALGYACFVLLDAIFLPLVFMIWKAIQSNQPEGQTKLQQRQDTVRKAISNGRQVMRALIKGDNPYQAPPSSKTSTLKQSHKPVDPVLPQHSKKWNKRRKRKGKVRGPR